MLKKALADIATVKAGHPFRGKIPEVKGGNAFAVQIRDINEENQIEWEQLVLTNIAGRKEPDWLTKGDILFAARGQRNVAAYVDEVNKPTVCGPHYFLIHLKANSKILPEFLSWQLNQQAAQRYFAQSAEGSSQISIRRAVLESAPIVIPSLEKQQKVVALNNKVIQEKRLLNKLIENRNKQMICIAQDILK